MAGTKAERLQEYLTSSQDVNERLRRLMSICSDKRSLSEEEEEVYDKVFRDTFAPTKQVNGVETLDVDTLKINIKAYKEEEAKLKVEKGRETVRWLKYFDSKDKEAGKEPERYESGRKVNMDKAIVATTGLRSEANVGYMYPSITGLCNEIENIPGGGKDNLSARDIVSDLIRAPYYPTGLFSPEDERLYMIGMLEPEKNLPRTDADKLYSFDNEKNALLVGKPWYDEKESEEYKEENSRIFEQPDYKKDVDFVKEVNKQDVPNDISEELNGDLHTFTNKATYEILDSYHVCKLVSEGKTFEEIEKLRPFKYDDLVDGYRVGISAEDKSKDINSSEFYQVTLDAVEKINEMNHKLFDKDVELESEEVKKSMDTQAKIRRMLEKSPMYLDDYKVARGKLITREEDYSVLHGQLKTIEDSFTLAYGNATPKRNLDKDGFEKALLKGGMASSVTNRHSSVVSNTIAFKAIKSADFDQKKPYDRQFVFDSGEDYLQFMEENPFNFDKDLSEEDKERNLKSVKANADFYRKWAEMNVTRFRFDNYTNMKNIKGHERELDMMEALCIDCSQDSQSIRLKYGKEFKEAFGGEKYYDALSNVNGLLQTVTNGTRALQKPNGDLAEKIRWKFFFEEAHKVCPLAGKNALEIDPVAYSFERANYFQVLTAKTIASMTPEEAEAYINEGRLQDDKRELLTKAWEKSSEVVPQELKESQRLVSSTLGFPCLKGDKKSFKTGLENSEEIVHFSANLKDLIRKEGKSSTNAAFQAEEMFLNSLPGGKLNGDMPNAATVYDAVTFSIPVNLSDEEKAKYVANDLKALYSSPEERNKVLDKVCKEIDNFSFANYNLDCLSGNDNGEKNMEGTTESQRDLLGLIKMVKLADSVKEFRNRYPDYFTKRYYNIEDWRNMTAKLDKLGAVKESLASKLNVNGLSIHGLKNAEIDEANVDSYAKDQVAFMMNDYALRSQSAQTLAREVDETGVIRFEPKDKETAKKTIAELGKVYQKVDTAGISNSLGWNEKEGKNLYIDGVRADVYIEPFTMNGESSEDVLNKFISEGKHRIENVIPTIDHYGNVTPIIQTIEPVTEESKEFFANDPNRADRIKAIKADFSRSLGEETQFKYFVSSDEINIPTSFYNNHNEKGYVRLEPVPPFNEVAAKHLEELSKIDNWYHKNSQEFKDIKTALEKPEDKQSVLNACDAYIGKYFKEKGQYERATDLGNARMKKIVEIKAFFKAEVEMENRMEKAKTAPKKQVEKEQINLLKEEEKKENKSKIQGGIGKQNKELNGNEHKLDGGEPVKGGK